MLLGMATALISFLNLVCLYIRRKAMPLVLNLVVDPIVVFYSFGWSVTGLVENSPWCEPECDGTSKWIQLLAGIGLSFALGLGLTHLALFLMRCVLAIRWVFEQRRNSSGPLFRIPTGQFTVEFTIRLLRQDNAVVPQSADGDQRNENITEEENRALA
ncbi:hypothetical protein I7I53_01310 [Histoplasma capsulatum var. duboisii H88]|uniref:Uncharacterized protein n=3 Tax=Ajellomyces capsulatus TaxID=5037 RepID=A0A8A1LIX8_AJEC8|nr:hypothetical protein I7I53_01310 [Histoplasma capsulatum var. duboisii H88]